jgi:hypothetical protein
MLARPRPEMYMHRKFAFAIAVLPLAALLLFAACGDDDSAPASQTTPSAAASTDAEPSTTPDPGKTKTAKTPGAEASPARGNAATAVEVAAAGGAEQATLQGVASARIQQHDSVAFRFGGSVPGYKVEYVDSPAACGSGQPVKPNGAVYIAVRFSPAVAHDGAGKAAVAPVLTGSGRLIPQALQSCDFEGVVTWVIGVNGEKVPFDVAVQGSVITVSLRPK